MLRKILPALFLALTSTFSQAQELHSKASLVQDGKSFASGMRIGVHLDIENGWHAYWQNPGDVGAPPTLDISSTTPIVQSDLFYPVPTRIQSDPFDFYGYEHETLVYKTLTLDQPIAESNIALKIQFDWLVCKVVCVPNSKSFDMTLPVEKSMKEKNDHFDSFYFPKENANIQTAIQFGADKTILTITPRDIDSFSTADFFPTSEVNQIYNKPISKEVRNGVATFVYPGTKSRETVIHGLLKVDNKTAYWIHNQKSGISEKFAATTHAKFHWGYVLILAFLGGILLNLMPCVLPVVSLKILSVLRSKNERPSKTRKANLIYAAGICSSLLCLAGIFLFFRGTGESLGWGFQLQSPAFVIFLTLLFFVIGLNLIGAFEVQGFSIPGMGKIFQGNSALSEFFSGFFITLVATPCTAPFMAVAIGYALAQSAVLVIATFLALGIGLAFPYLILAFFPQIARVFPKPGAWMIKLKEILSFPMFLTVVWLVWLLNQLTQTKAVLFVLIALVLIVFFIWSQKNLFRKNGKIRKLFLLLIAVAIFLVSYFPLQLEKPDVIQWEPFETSKVATYGTDRLTFVDFTADWCITCKVNERVTLSNSDVIEVLQKNNVRTVKADWTKRNPEITAILQQYESAGVPFYLLYKPGLTSPMVLPTLLTPGILINAIVGNKGE